MKFFVVITLAFALVYGQEALNNDNKVDTIDACPSSEKEDESSGCGRSNQELHSTCPISVSTKYEATECQQLRTESVTENRKYYKLTVQNETKTIEFPWGNKIPFLNQSMDAVKAHTASDKIDSKWIKIIISTKENIKQRTAKNVMKKKRQFDSINDYKEAYREHVNNIKDMKELKFISNPATEDTFTPMIDNDLWMTDEFFVQQRLAGPCPFLIKMVTVDGSVGMKWDHLKPMLNQTYDFDAAIERALQTEGFTLDDVVKKNMMYVLHEEDSNNVKTRKEDFFHSITHSQLQNLTSPITLFVRTPGGDLKVVAIQIDYTSDSEVFSPESDDINWMLAKTMVNLVDHNYCQSVWHLSHIHFSSSVYCHIFRSHFSELHPMYHIMMYHCEGTTPHIALSWPTLVTPSSPADQFYAFGSEGYANMAINGQSKYRYGLLAFDNLLTSRGLNSKEITYHPFRDDGEVLWGEFQSFAKEFVNMFYKDDSDITNDEELQSFANEVSAHGEKEPFGGRGKIIGFPDSFRTKEGLNIFITRFIWLIAMHVAVNYPIEPWYTFVPIFPPKMYDHEITHVEKNIAHALPDAPTTMGGLTYATLIGNLRMNRIMEHYEKVRHEKLSSLIKRHHDRLHTTVQRRLETRNAERKANQKMGFQYFEPKWLTNSIHI